MRRLLLVAAAALLAVALAGCGDEGREPTVQEIVVPRGTQERLVRGETVDVMPAVMEFAVGDSLRIRNDDVVDQEVGPYFVRAGEEFELTYGSAGTYEGVCPLSEGLTYKIVVTD